MIIRKIVLLFLISTIGTLNAQNNDAKTTDRKGFVFGAAAGISGLNIQRSGSVGQNHTGGSFPNFKPGVMLNKRTALLICMPGSIYKHKGTGRQRDRGFEGIIPSVQYWIKDRLWILGGAGLTMDAPAFYDIRSEDERKFYFGASMISGIGYELWKKNNFALDIQGRVHYGYANIAEGKQTGTSVNLLIGFNWY